jgi:hypothetical protein
MDTTSAQSSQPPGGHRKQLCVWQYQLHGFRSTGLHDQLSSPNISKTCWRTPPHPSSVPASSVLWNRPRDMWSCSQIAECGHCSRCGARMTMRYCHQLDELSIAANTVDKSMKPLPRPETHVFLREKAAWFELPDDGIKRYHQFSHRFEEKLDKWKQARKI